MKKELPPLSAAIKRVRKAYGDTQEAFARRLDVAMITISRFERGTEPKDLRVLLRLEEAARMINLTAEAEAFARATIEAQRGRASDDFNRPFVNPSTYTRVAGLRAHSLMQWRLMAAARTASLYFPGLIAGIEKAAAPALEFVDGVIKNASDAVPVDYAALDQALDDLAEQRALAALKGKMK